MSHSLFHGDTLLKVVEASLRDAGVASCHLELELTESIAMRNVDLAIAMLKELKTMGVQLSIDDFGTGYSSLSYLQRLPIDIVKIDQSFIREILTQSKPIPIVRAIIAIAHSLQLGVLAEGVEEEEQRSILVAEGCDFAQGYLFGKPMPAEDFAKLLSITTLPNAS